MVNPIPTPVQVVIDPPEFFDILKPLKDFLNFIVGQIFSLAKTIFSFVQEKIITPLVNAISWVIDNVVNAIKSFVSNVINTIVNLFRPSDPEKIVSNLPLILGTVALGSLGTGLLLTAINTKVMGSGVDVEPLAKMVSQLFRPSLIISFTMGTVFGLAIRTPLTYWAKKTFRPNKPEPLTLFGLYTRGYITREQLKSELAYVTGFNDKYIDGLIDIFEYNPTFFDLLRMADYVELSDDFIKKSLTVLGVKEPYFSIIFKLIKKRPLREEIRSVVNHLVNLYANGLINKEFLSNALDGLDVQPMEKRLILMYAENKRVERIKELRIEILKIKFAKGLIEEATIINELEKMGIEREFINLIIERGKLSRKVELPIPKITRGFSFELPISTSIEYSLL